MPIVNILILTHHSFGHFHISHAALSSFAHSVQLEMHCHLRQTVVLGLTRGRLCGPVVHQRITFQRHSAMYGRVIDDLAIFTRQILGR